MRTAKIGTIMPWSGDGGNGNLPSNIPKGWIVCKGQQDLLAKEYPLLAAELGDTYGGNMTVAGIKFPYQDSTASFGLPNLSSYCPMDLEPFHLANSKYQAGQPDAANILKSNSGEDLVKDLGQTTPIGTTYQAYADIEFTLNLSGSLYVKFGGIQLSAPDFAQSVYTLNRKLGINHTPRHRHSDQISTVSVRQEGAQPFYHPTNSIQMYGDAVPFICENLTESPIECSIRAGLNMPSWRNGKVSMTYSGTSDFEDTMPDCTMFREYVSDTDAKNYWSHIPAGASQWKSSHLGTARTALGNTDRGSGHKNPEYRQNYFEKGVTAEIQLTTPKDTHKMPCYTGMFPRPIEDSGRPNFYGYTDLSTQNATAPVKGGITDHPEEMGFFQVNNVTLDNTSNEITLPVGTDIRRLYGTNPDTWYQWDKITPLMYVTMASNDEKWLLNEGTQVLSLERNADGSYLVRLDKNPLESATGKSIRFRHGTYGTSLSARNKLKNPLNNDFKGHNHDSFEIMQKTGSIPTQVGTFLSNYTASNANGSSLQADTINNALNIAVDTAQPSLTVTFIIKAY